MNDSSEFASSRDAPSFLSYLFSSSVNTPSRPRPISSREYYKGFYRAHKHDADPSKGQPAEERSFSSAFFRQLLLSAIPIGGTFLLMRFIFNLSRSAGAEAFQKMIDPPRTFLSSLSSKKGPLVSVNGNKKKVSFSDIIGIDEAKEEVKQYITFLNDPRRFVKMGARMPKGCLLEGGPGTGKTYLVKSIAHEAGVPLLTACGADFCNIFLGSGAKTIRQLFDEARENAPCIVFIDELDAIGDRKPADASPGSMEDNRIINQLLKELDGLYFDTSSTEKPIVVFAATNYSEKIDRALLRAGRFDRKIFFPLPDRDSRKALFRYYLSKVKLDSPIPWSPHAPNMLPLSVDQQKFLGQLADLSAGLSPAAISTIVNNACLIAAEDTAEKFVTEAHIISSIEKILTTKHGNQSGASSSISEEICTIKARQHAARVLIAWMFPQQEDVIRVSVEGRGTPARKSYMLQRQPEYENAMTVLHLFSALCVQVAAHSVEKLFREDSPFLLTPMVQRDTRMGTGNVFDQMLSYGMPSRKFGMLSHRESARLPKGQVEATVSGLRQAEAEELGNLRMAFAQHVVFGILSNHRDTLLSLESELIAKGSLGFSEIENVLGARPMVPPLTALHKDKLVKLYSGCS